MSHIVKATELKLFAKFHDDWSKQSVSNATLPNYCANCEVTRALTFLSKPKTYTAAPRLTAVFADPRLSYCEAIFLIFFLLTSAYVDEIVWCCHSIETSLADILRSNSYILGWESNIYYWKVNFGQWLAVCQKLFLVHSMSVVPLTSSSFDLMHLFRLWHDGDCRRVSCHALLF